VLTIIILVIISCHSIYLSTENRKEKASTN